MRNGRLLLEVAHLNSEQWFGVLALFIGGYFVVCAGWKRDFVLYRLKAQRVVNLFGAPFAHGFYFLLGVACVVSGVLKVLGIWGPPS